MPELPNWLAAVPFGRLVPPSTIHELEIDQTICCLIYFLIAALLGWYRGSFDIVKVVRAVIAGASLPPTLLLATAAFDPDALALLSDATMTTYLMIGGIVLSILSIYGLFL